MFLTLLLQSTSVHHPLPTEQSLWALQVTAVWLARCYTQPQGVCLRGQNISSRLGKVSKTPVGGWRGGAISQTHSVTHKDKHPWIWREKKLSPIPWNLSFLFASLPPPTQLLLIRFWPNFECKFLVSTTTTTIKSTKTSTKISTRSHLLIISQF